MSEFRLTVLDQLVDTNLKDMHGKNNIIKHGSYVVFDTPGSREVECEQLYKPSG